MQIAAEPALYYGGSTDNAAACQIAFAGQMHIATRSNASAETAADFIVAQINVRATSWTNCRSGCATNLLFPFAFETLDDGTALSLPKFLEPTENRGALRCRRFFFCPQLQARFWREGRKRAAALAADRAFCCRILHLLEATVRTFRTDFYKRRIGHWTLSQGPFFMRALQRLL
jgi:hypothetical protein